MFIDTVWVYTVYTVELFKANPSTTPLTLSFFATKIGVFSDASLFMRKKRNSLHLG